MNPSLQLQVKTPPYVMLSSDYSAQEPRLTSFVANEHAMIEAFQEDRDIYASIASLAFGVPYENCLEFHPVTGENQPDGKKRRNEAKTILLGITYGRSVPSIAEQLYNKRDDLSDEEKTKRAQKVYDSVLNAFPNLRKLMLSTQKFAKENGYVTTILGRRRHLPDMQLEEFEFVPMKGYVNPDFDPLDISGTGSQNEIPLAVINQLKEEFAGYKYYGQIAKRIRELYDQHIRVINNRPKINDASRQCLNCVSLDTEILTKDGWKSYSELEVGQPILSFNLNTQQVEDDSIQAININSSETEVVRFKSPTFESVSTLNHRWVVGESDERARIKLTQNIYNNRWPDYPILRIADNNLSSTCKYSDYELKLIGWILTDGSYNSGLSIYQSTRREKNYAIYQDMINTLDSLGIKYNDQCRDGIYHDIYIYQSDFTENLKINLPDRVLNNSFISKLSQHQANILMWAMIEGDGTLGRNHTNITYSCSTIAQRDAFQYLAFIAGYATNAYVIDPAIHNSYPSSNKVYSSTSNTQPIKVTQPYYTVSVLRIRRAHIYPNHKSLTVVSGVWCPTTQNGTWIARYNGKVFITGNSIIQGSAADQTKMAILLLEQDEEWKKLGGRLLVPIHDELLVEVPIQNWEKGAEILSNRMIEAADFLPFPSKCDVTTSLRWYGLEYPCKYPKPSVFDTQDEDEVKWIQYHLIEMEYQLPILPNDDGSPLLGDAAVGINGRRTPELEDCVSDYVRTRDISIEDFIKCIEHEVVNGNRYFKN